MCAVGRLGVTFGIAIALGASSPLPAAELGVIRHEHELLPASEPQARCTVPNMRTAEQTTRLDALGREVFEPPLPGLGMQSRTIQQKDLIQRFGKPRKVTTSLETSNYYDPPPDRGYERMNWDFDGLVISTLGDVRSAKDDPERWLFIDTIVVDSDRHALRHGFRIGLSRSEVLALLGCTPNDRGDVLHYENEKPVYQIEINLDEGGRVKRARWTWWWH